MRGIMYLDVCIYTSMPRIHFGLYLFNAFTSGPCIFHSNIVDVIIKFMRGNEKRAFGGLFLFHAFRIAYADA